MRFEVLFLFSLFPLSSGLENFWKKRKKKNWLKRSGISNIFPGYNSKTIGPSLDSLDANFESKNSSIE